ncbi:hypothetical protein DFH09DRAFT_371800 [Mycena vulgaris]|nr:hypothetical protein DFH09DRAFT_371800 [Mycena vulgaris]
MYEHFDPRLGALPASTAPATGRSGRRRPPPLALSGGALIDSPPRAARSSSSRARALRHLRKAGRGSSGVYRSAAWTALAVAGRAGVIPFAWGGVAGTSYLPPEDGRLRHPPQCCKDAEREQVVRAPRRVPYESSTQARGWVPDGGGGVRSRRVQGAPPPFLGCISRC